MPNGGQIIFRGEDLSTEIGGLTARNLGAIPAPAISIYGCLEYFIDYSKATHHALFLYDLSGVDLKTGKIDSPVLSKHPGWGNSTD
jgi:hypothetical protein